MMPLLVRAKAMSRTDVGKMNERCATTGRGAPWEEEDEERDARGLLDQGVRLKLQDGGWSGGCDEEEWSGVVMMML